MRERLYISLTGDQRLITLGLPTTKAALILRGLRLRRRKGPVGIERLDATIVINLADRRDRLSAFMREMAVLQIRHYSRFEAVRDANGALGCLSSHAECLKSMLANSWRCIMICEDDARFRVSRKELDVLVDAFIDDSTAEVACLAYRQCGPPKRYNLLFVRAPE